MNNKYADWGGKLTDGYMGGSHWVGLKSRPHLYGAELTKAIRADLKAHGIKGVTIAKSRGGMSIYATITCTKADITDSDGVFYIHGEDYDRISVNHYRLERYAYVLSPELFTKVCLVNACLSSYQDDDSCIMVDYFNSNFYYNITLKVKGDTPC